MDLLASRRRATLTATVALTTAAAGIAWVSGASASPYASMHTTVLAGDVLPGLAKAHDDGATNPDRKVLVGLVLARPDASGVANLERRIYTPGSSDYHHFLTPAEFEAEFAVPQARYDATLGWATRDGMTLARTTAMRDYVTVTGTAAQAEQTFSVGLHDYRQDGQGFFANTAAPTIPAGLGITGVIGLNSKLKMTLPTTSPAEAKAATAHGYVVHSPAAVRPHQDNCTGPLCIGLTTPQDLWSVYDQPTNNYGQGQSMAIFGEGETDTVVTNLRTFEQVHNLPQIPVSVVRTDGAGPYNDSAGDVEWAIDTQSSTGMAPEALSEKLYFAQSLSDASVLDDFEAWVEDPNGPLQASASFGECEENPVGNASASGGYAFSASTQFTEATEAALQQAVIEGRTLFASTGDTGSSCPVVPVDVNGVGNEAYPVVNYPASSPEVVAVGGTVLYTDGTGATQTGLTPSGASRVEEYSWNYTGGGSSVTFPQPDYQQKYSAPTPASFCVDAPDGSTVTPGTVTCRGIPDIAAQSGDVQSNGYGIVASGQTNYPGGGTSLSSPLSLGMWTRINAAAPAKVVNGTTTYPGLGFANEAYYKDYATNPGDFFDVGGGPTSPPNSNGTYASAPGDDYLSGLGIPDVAKVAQHVDGTTAPANPVLPTYPPATPSINPCSATLFTDPAGDDAFIGDPAGSGSNPQLDILSGNMQVSGANLVTTLTINDLSTNSASAGGAANEYYFLWSYKGTQYFSNAEVDTTTGTITYSDGTVAGNQYTTVHKTDTGSFNQGKNGTVVVNVPLTNVGSPATGDTLLGPAGQTKVLVGTSTTGGLIEAADSGGPQYDFQIGAVCDPSSPTPTASVPTQTVSPSPFGSTSPTATGTTSTSPTSTTSTSPTSTSPTSTTSSTIIPSFTFEPTPSKTATSSPTPTSTKTGTPTPSPTPTSPTPTPSPTRTGPQPQRHHHRPRYHVHREEATSRHPSRVEVTISDRYKPLTALTHVHLVGCRWSLGSATDKAIHGRHFWMRIFFVRTATARSIASFTIVDKRGHTRHVKLHV
jgi:subtilase family serine protease